MHLLRVAHRVRCEFGLTDPDLTLAALLHDVLEDHPGVSLSEDFGPRVLELVRALTNSGDYTAHVLGMLRGPAGPVKLADFMDNALALGQLEPARAKRLRAKYTPVAAGILEWLREMPAGHPFRGVEDRISAQYP